MTLTKAFKLCSKSAECYAGTDAQILRRKMVQLKMVTSHNVNDPCKRE